jgi:cytochrome c peroxidase
MRTLALAVLAIGAAALALHAQQATPEPTWPTWSDKELARIAQHSPLPPAPSDPTNKVESDPRAAELGKRLFFDKRLSRDGTLACASCHDPEKAFCDERATSQGLALGTRNAPTLWNIAQQRWFFWDGRADSLWSQALKPIEGANELGGSRVKIVELVNDDAALRSGFLAVFGELPRANDAMTIDKGFANVGKLLAAFERTLVKCESPFDRYAAALVKNDVEAQANYPASARRGLRLFLGKGNCRLCHAGPSFSDGEFHNLGVPPLEQGTPTEAARSQGLERALADPFNALGPFSDERKGRRADELARLVRSSETFGAYRTPSLRNVALTAPYMHAGQFATLRAVLGFYSTREGAIPAGHHGEQVLQPLHFSEAEIEDLVSFLESLTGAPVR